MGAASQTQRIMDPPDEFHEYDRVFSQVVAEEAGLLDLPIVTQMDFGHTDPMMVLPYGLQAEINCETQEIAILESGVIDHQIRT